MRNRIRWKVIPEWEKVSEHDVVEGAARSRSFREEDDLALDAWLDAVLEDSLTGVICDLGSLTGKPVALYRRAIHRWLLANKLEEELSFKAFASLLEAVLENRPSRISIGKQREVEHRNHRLSILSREDASSWPMVTMPWKGQVFFQHGASLTAESIMLEKIQFENIVQGRVDEKKNAFLKMPSGQLKLRQWLPGDRYRPLNAPGSAKLQDMFVNHKISPGERKQLPVVYCDESKILWCPGLPPADTCKITRNTLYALKLTYART